MSIDTITLRRSTAADGEALRRLAALDSASPPDGDALLAESGGDLVAAVSLDGRRAIADPFRPTAPVVAMLRAWSRSDSLAA